MLPEITSVGQHQMLNIIVGLIVVAGVKLFNAPVEHAPIQAPAAAHKTILVEAGEYQSHYRLGKSIKEPFLVVAINPQKQRTHPLVDFHSSFVTFSPAATQKYMSKYAGMTHCPARFLNRHADNISLYAGNDNIAKSLSRWKQTKGSDVKRWEIVDITGHCLDKREKIERNGEDVTDSTRMTIIGRKASRDCHMIYVTNIERTDATVQSYMGG